MYVSIMNDELGVDFAEGAHYLKEWGLKDVDMRNMVFGKPFEKLSCDELKRAKDICDENGLTVRVFQSSVGKVHLPKDPAVVKEQYEKLEVLIKAKEIFGCSMVRMFPFYQPSHEDFGTLKQGSREFDDVIKMAEPLFKFAYDGGLDIAVEDCGIHSFEVLNVNEVLKQYNPGLALDAMAVWGTLEYGDDEDGFLKKVVPHVKNFHVKYCTLPAYVGKPMTFLPGNICAVKVPWMKLLTMFKEAGYDGSLTVETHYPLMPDPKPTELEVTHSLVTYLQGVLDTFE